MDLDHERRLTEVEERSKSNSKRLEGVEKRQDELGDLVSSVKVLAEREKNVENDVKEIKSDVKSITSKPAKRWELVITTAITVILTAVLTYAITKLGL